MPPKTLIRPRTAAIPSFNRASLVPGVDKPNTTLYVGTPPEMVAGLDNVTGLTTITSDGEDLIGYNFLGRIVIDAENVKIRKSLVQGPLSTPGDGSALIECKNASVVNALIEDTTIIPQYAHWNNDSAIVGHDFTARRVLIDKCTDGITVYNQFGGSTYQTNVLLEMVWVKSVALWTAASNGTVHPSDIVTHSDAVQHQGGLGTIFRGCFLQGIFTRQYGHWFCTGDPTVPPYTFIALNSLPAGNPGYGGPFQVTPDAGSGRTEANGRYNIGGLGSLATVMIGDDVGPSGNLLFDRNWLDGGDYTVNGGGAVNTGGYTMTFTGNRFTRNQGTQQGGGNLTQTINFQQGEDSWQGGFVIATGNVYEDNGAAITVRT